MTHKSLLHPSYEEDIKPGDDAKIGEAGDAICSADYVRIIHEDFIDYFAMNDTNQGTMKRLNDP